MRTLLAFLLLCSAAQAQVSFERVDPGITDHLTEYKQTVDPALWWMWGVEVADVDGDGKPDIYLATHNYSSGFLYLQGDNLQFTHADTGWDPKDMPAQRRPAIADFTGNGKMDIVPHEGLGRSMLQKEDGTFIEGNFRLPNSSDVIEDITGNGFLDAHTSRRSWGQRLLRTYTNQMPDSDRFEFTEAAEPIPDDIPEETRAIIEQRQAVTTTNNRYAGPLYWRGDLNGNGREDLIVQYGGSYAGGGIRMGRYLFRDDDGMLVDKTDTCGIPGHVLPIFPPGDTHGNCKLSILTGYGSINETGLYVQGPDDAFTLQRVGSTVNTTTTMGRATYASSGAVYIHDLHWLDLDGDGDLDAIVSRRRGEDLYIYENHGGLLLETHYLRHWDADGYKIADVNGNGKPDLVIGGRGEDPWLAGGSSQDTTVWLYLNTADYDPDPQEPDPDEPDPEPLPLIVTLTIDGEVVTRPIDVLLNDEPVGGPGDKLEVVIGPEEDPDPDPDPDPEPEPIAITPETIELVEQAEPGQSFVLARGIYRPFTIRNRQGNTITADGLVRIHGNTALHGHAITVESSEDITLDGLTCSGGMAGIAVYRSPNVTVTNCTLRNNARWGIFASFADDFEADGNKCYDNGAEHGIYVSNSSQRPIVTDNICTGHPRTGIQINADVNAGDIGVTRGAVVRGNKLMGNNIGINLDGVQDSLIEDNVIGDGLRIYRIDGAEPSSNNTIRGNVILGRDNRHACVVRDGSTGNLFEFNTFRVPEGTTFPLSQQSPGHFVSRNNAFIGRGLTPIGTGADGTTAVGLDDIDDVGSIVR